MKTVMQELLQVESDLSRMFDSDLRVAMALLEHLRANKSEILEKEKEQACDFADYVINRAKEFEDGLIDHREYEGSIDEMFERRYRDGGTKLSTEEKQYWEDVDKLRKEREEKYK
jgi:hypothetical protein